MTITYYRVRLTEFGSPDKEFLCLKEARDFVATYQDEISEFAAYKQFWLYAKKHLKIEEVVETSRIVK